MPKTASCPGASWKAPVLPFGASCQPFIPLALSSHTGAFILIRHLHSPTWLFDIQNPGLGPLLVRLVPPHPICQSVRAVFIQQALLMA